MNDKAKHKWAATGVSSYPLSHPIVGQGRFYESFKHFIHLVDDEAERFAHVFAVIAQWGVGKSRLGYELVAQINDSSRGWWVRDEAGALAEAKLFHNEADRAKYLSLYIRYSQVANDYNNVDNWFAYGLYKALLPLARNSFDGSIQGQIAKEAADRLMVNGFDAQQLAAVLEVSAKHSDEKLYEDPELAGRLCQAAYDYLETLGIQYVLVVLDELETAAEAATFGLDSTDIKHLDGRAIKLMGKAIKEEDPRRKLPWLRYVALCSPAIGDELREIQSTARRFELAELHANAFADVSDFVQRLSADGRLAETYPQGLVEAAYAMSAGNFGWFNVIMASIDQCLNGKRMRGEKDAPTLGALFDELVRVSGRVSEHVLDHHAIEMLRIEDRSQLGAARDLLYGQLPIALSDCSLETRTNLLSARNEYDEPVANRFCRVEWDAIEATHALQTSKFTRDRGMWRLGGVDQPLDLRQLLSNLGTYAIHETKGKQRSDGKHLLLVPVRQSDFIQLVAMLYPHPAAEDAARALWRKFLGSEDLEPESATHIGPSVAMIARLDIRHRKQGHTALIFRDPDQNAAHEQILSTLKSQSERDRAAQVLVGAMRVIDQNWTYDLCSAGFRDETMAAIITSPSSRGSAGGGLVSCDGLKLHPKGRALFAWVKNEEDLRRLCQMASNQFDEEGRTPVIAFTASRSLVDIMSNPTGDLLKHAGTYLLLYQLTSTEEHIFHQIGIARTVSQGFRLDGHSFTTAFSGRLQSLVRPFIDEVGRFRQQLNERGCIAWPLRSTGRLKESEQALLINAWCVLLRRPEDQASLALLDDKSGVDIESLKALLAKLGVSPKAHASGYHDHERAGLFTRLDDAAEAQVPTFLTVIIKRFLSDKTWTRKDADREWFWGYTWEGVKTKDTYLEWMSISCHLGFAIEQPQAKAPDTYGALTRAALVNAHQEADNWLKKDYAEIVHDMEAVFGIGRVGDLFASESSPAPGTKTQSARIKLNQAKMNLDSLGGIETAAITSTSIRNSAQRRLDIIEQVGWVFDRDEFIKLQQDANVKTLDFDSDEVSLWRRIRRASLFVAYVRRVEKVIKARCGTLGKEMQQECESIKGFPIALFTLSFAKIVHILDGALSQGAKPGATEQKQSKDPGTLRHNLRDLKIADATVQLDGLAKEVGLDLSNWTEKPLASCDGQIVTTFCELKKTYEQLRKDLTKTVQRIEVLGNIIKDAPPDFTYPTTVLPMDKLRSRPALIEEILEGARSDDVDRLRDEYDAPARIGNFHPLMENARGLLDEPKNALANLLGPVITVENTVSDYRQRLAEKAELVRAYQGLVVLTRIKKKDSPQQIGVKEIEAAGTLAEGQKLVQNNIVKYRTNGDGIISATGVSFDRWCKIANALESDRDPEMDPKEAESLVMHGFVRRSYRLGGIA